MKQSKLVMNISCQHVLQGVYSTTPHSHRSCQSFYLTCPVLNIFNKHVFIPSNYVALTIPYTTPLWLNPTHLLHAYTSYISMNKLFGRKGVRIQARATTQIGTVLESLEFVKSSVFRKHFVFVKFPQSCKLLSLGA